MTTGVRFTANRFVFTMSVLMVVLFVGTTAALNRLLSDFFPALLTTISTYFGWLFLLAVAGFLGFCAWIATSRYGSVRLGKPDQGKEFSTLSWLSMLFSAGMGIGLLFYGVAEPVMHFAAPPEAAPRTIEAAQDAMMITFFHWGLHAWSVYCLVGLCLAYFHFRHDLPMSLRSCLFPWLGERIHGPAGNVLDLLAVFATLFGLATSLGLGAVQVNAGLHYLFGVAEGPTSQLVIIAVITACATVSVFTGLYAGVRRLSELNMLIAATLLAFVFIAGPTTFLLDSFVDNVGRYLAHAIPRTFLRGAHREGDWFASWTVFYWAWWVAWSPFVGTFIARISRGRTIREFVLGVLLVPSVMTFVWLTAFGDTALHMITVEGIDIASAVEANPATAIYAMLAELPGAAVTTPIAVLLVALFFVTSSDSGSLVVDMLTSGGLPDPPTWQRIFWALMEGAVAGSLLVLGGLKALQAAAISAGLPLVLVVIIMAVGLVKALRHDHAQEATQPSP